MVETRWRVVTLPRRPEDTPLEIYVVVPTDDPEVIEQVEDACKRSGMAMYRVTQEEDQ